MKTILITKTITLKPDQITEDTEFIVNTDLGNSPAIIIEGYWKNNKEREDRFDHKFKVPCILLRCNYKSAGILIIQCDNTDFGPIKVVESLGTAVEIRSLRQCMFDSIRCHRCISSTNIVLFSGNTSSFSSNMILISLLSCMGCDAPVTVQMINALKNDVRIITICQLLCHIPWEPLRRDFPRLKNSGPRERIHFDIGDATAITVLSCNFRMDANDPDSALAVSSGKEAENCAILNGQILKVRGKTDLSKLVVGNTVVFPFVKK